MVKEITVWCEPNIINNTTTSSCHIRPRIPQRVPGLFNLVKAIK